MVGWRLQISQTDGFLKENLGEEKKNYLDDTVI